MTRHPAAASRILVVGASVAGTLFTIGALSHQARADAVEKAHRKAVAMREWNQARTKANAELLEWTRKNPEIVVRTVRRTHYYTVVVPVAAAGATAIGPVSPRPGNSPGGSAASPGTGTSAGGSAASSGSSSGPAPAKPPSSPPSDPPPPDETSGGSY